MHHLGSLEKRVFERGLYIFFSSPVSFHISKKYIISNVSWQTVINVHVKHHQIGGKAAFIFWADWIRTGCHGSIKLP